MKISLLLLIPLVLSLKSFEAAAQNRVGNGGDVIECASHTELLDFYESDKDLKMFAATVKYEAVLEEVLKNIERLNPKQSKHYKKRALEMIAESDFKKDIALTDVKDSKHLFIPKNKSCELKQIAIRRHQATLSGKRFVIDKELWDKLSERDKAGLVMHEVIYEHLFKLGEEDSVKAREINAYFFSEVGFKESPEAYWKIIKTMKIPIYK